MNKVVEILNKIKALGFTSLLSLAIGVLLGLYGMMFWSGVAFGVFVKANWDIIYKLWNDNVNL